MHQEMRNNARYSKRNGWTSVLFYSIVICVRCFIGSDIEYPRELVLEGGTQGCGREGIKGGIPSRKY